LEPGPIHRIVRTRRKTIALIVESDGSLTVRAPQNISEGRIRAFVLEHAGWVEKHQRKARHNPPPVVHLYRPGETFLFLGEEYPLRLSTRRGRDLRFESGAFDLPQALQPKGALIFTQWYKEQARLEFTDRLATLAQAHSLRYQKMRLSSARTRWGSCSPNGTISLTWRLVMASPEVVDYVILHELVHTRIRNHSKTFWAQVETLMPTYRNSVRWLKQYGRLLTL
jgi:predicted metal-dependent hydrolase